MKKIYLIIVVVLLLMPLSTLAKGAPKKASPVKKVAPVVITVERRTGAEDLPVDSLALTAVLIRDETTASNIVDVGSSQSWPLASLTKLMTALVFLDHNPGWNKPITLAAGDEVGGARLWVKEGTRFTTKEAFTMSLVGSANNTTNALARSTGLSRNRFVELMNAKAKKFGMTHTTFVEPTGIEPANISTAHDVALLIRETKQKSVLQETLQKKEYRWYNRATRKVHTIKNTNKLLTGAPFRVLGGKTGLLDESGGNLVMRVTDGKHPLTIVIFGAEHLADTFGIAKQLALWTWKAHQWVKKG